MTLDEFFAGRDDSRRLYAALAQLIETLGPVAVRVTKSQVAFRHRRAFAWAWAPAQYLHRPGPPLVLTVALRRRDPSPRWKQVVEPAPGRFTHHLEVNQATDLDPEVLAWLQEAWAAAS